MKPIRNRVEVIIYNRETSKILVAHWERQSGIQYVFPGGGIEANESVAQAAYKEALEEVGIKVDQVREVHRGPIKPIHALDHASEVHYSGDQTVYVTARFKDKDYSKYNCEGDAMNYEWVEPIVAAGKVRDGSQDGEHRAQAIRNIIPLKAAA